MSTCGQNKKMSPLCAEFRGGKYFPNKLVHLVFIYKLDVILIY